VHYWTCNGACFNDWIVNVILVCKVYFVISGLSSA